MNPELERNLLKLRADRALRRGDLNGYLWPASLDRARPAHRRSAPPSLLSLTRARPAA